MKKYIIYPLHYENGEYRSSNHAFVNTEDNLKFQVCRSVFHFESDGIYNTLDILDALEGELDFKFNPKIIDGSLTNENLNREILDRELLKFNFFPGSFEPITIEHYHIGQIQEDNQTFEVYVLVLNGNIEVDYTNCGNTEFPSKPVMGHYLSYNNDLDDLVCMWKMNKTKENEKRS